MKKTIIGIIATIYGIIAIFTTVCLLSYNDHKISEFGDYSVVIISEDNVNENLNKGDIVVLNKKSLVKDGEYGFFYNTYSKKMEVTCAKVMKSQKVNQTEVTYTLEGDKDISAQYLLGPLNGCVKIAKVGTVLGILESKWGFLFLIVFPALIEFIYQITVVISEIRGSKE